MADEDALDGVDVGVDSWGLGLEPLGAVEVGLGWEEGEEKGGSEHEVQSSAVATGAGVRVRGESIRPFANSRSEVRSSFGGTS